MAIINFPNSPAVNDTFTVNGVLYTWDGVKWSTAAQVAEPASGGTGRATLTANALLVGDTLNPVKFISPGTANNVLISDGTEWKSQAGGLVPAGAISMWSTTTAPTGYLLCDGTAVSRTTYAVLFAVIGTTFGAGDSSTTFNLPNFTNRMPIGTGSIAALAATGGSKDASIISHSHTATSTVTDPGHFHTTPLPSTWSVSGAGGVTFTSGAAAAGSGYNGVSDSKTTGISVGTSISTAGVSGTNANLPPYLGINFIIKT